MKKVFSLFLALTMIFALCACGNNADNDASTESKKEQTDITKKVGDSASTDMMEVVLNDVSFSKYYNEDVRISKDGYSFAVVKFSLKNIGKTDLGFVHNPIKKVKSIQPSAIVYIDYNDGFSFCVDDVKIADSNFGEDWFCIPKDVRLTDLKPLSTAVDFEASICVPDEVVENISAPLLVNFYLLASDGETKTVSFSVR